MILAKHLYNNMYDIRTTDEQEVVAQLQSDGYAVCDITTPLPSDDSAYSSYNIELRFNDTTRHYDLHYYTDAAEIAAEKIKVLETELAESDYKIIKLMEHLLLAMQPVSVKQDDAPDYDIVALHAERAEIRKQIRQLRSALEGQSPETAESR